MLNRKGILRYLLLESIKKEIIYEAEVMDINDIRSIEENNNTFVKRVLADFITTALQYFNFVEVEEYLAEVLGLEKKNR